MVEKFEEYRLFSEHVQRLSERRQAASQTYLTVNTAIVGVLAFLAKDAGFRGWGLVGVSVPLFVVGILACVVWYRIIVQFKAIIGWHYEQLRAMEADLDESARVYTKEWERFFKPTGGRERFGFSRLEAWLPGLLVALYAIYAVVMVVATMFGWV
jgi:hypothetical protein